MRLKELLFRFICPLRDLSKKPEGQVASEEPPGCQNHVIAKINLITQLAREERDIQAGRTMRQN
jgi:hypothetical protein